MSEYFFCVFPFHIFERQRFQDYQPFPVKAQFEVLHLEIGQFGYDHNKFTQFFKISFVRMFITYQVLSRFLRKTSHFQLLMYLRSQSSIWKLVDENTQKIFEKGNPTQRYIGSHACHATIFFFIPPCYFGKKGGLQQYYVVSTSRKLVCLTFPQHCVSIPCPWCPSLHNIKCLYYTCMTTFCCCRNSTTTTGRGVQHIGIYYKMSHPVAVTVPPPPLLLPQQHSTF